MIHVHRVFAGNKAYANSSKQDQHRLNVYTYALDGIRSYVDRMLDEDHNVEVKDACAGNDLMQIKDWYNYLVDEISLDWDEMPLELYRHLVLNLNGNVQSMFDDIMDLRERFDIDTKPMRDFLTRYAERSKLHEIYGELNALMLDTIDKINTFAEKDQ